MQSTLLPSCTNRTNQMAPGGDWKMDPLKMVVPPPSSLSFSLSSPSKACFETTINKHSTTTSHSPSSSEMEEDNPHLSSSSSSLSYCEAASIATATTATLSTNNTTTTTSNQHSASSLSLWMEEEEEESKHKNEPKGKHCTTSRRTSAPIEFRTNKLEDRIHNENPLVVAEEKKDEEDQGPEQIPNDSEEDDNEEEEEEEEDLDNWSIWSSTSSTCSKKSCLSTSSTSNKHHGPPRRVSFHQGVQVQSHAVTLGQHPCNSDGLALTLDWYHADPEQVTLDQHSKSRQHKYQMPKRLSFLERRDMLFQASAQERNAELDHVIQLLQDSWNDHKRLLPTPLSLLMEPVLEDDNDDENDLDCSEEKEEHPNNKNSMHQNATSPQDDRKETHNVRSSPHILPSMARSSSDSSKPSSLLPEQYHWMRRHDKTSRKRATTATTSSQPTRTAHQKRRQWHVTEQRQPANASRDVAVNHIRGGLHEEPPPMQWSRRPIGSSPRHGTNRSMRIPPRPSSSTNTTSTTNSRLQKCYAAPQSSMVMQWKRKTGQQTTSGVGLVGLA